jgi:hypothetical protein
MRTESERPDAGGRHRFCWHPSPMAVRYMYTALFLLANIFAWVVRESHVTFFEGQRHNGCHGDHDCLAADAVLVISHTCFVRILAQKLETFYLPYSFVLHFGLNKMSITSSFSWSCFSPPCTRTSYTTVETHGTPSGGRQRCSSWRALS